MRTLIRGGTVIAPDTTLPGHCLVIEGGVVTAIAPEEAVLTQPDDQLLSAAGGWVAPGLIDIHIHGCAGADTMDATPAALRTMARFLAAHGVTSFLPTVISAGPEATTAALAAWRGLLPGSQGAQPLGLHLEGPYLNGSLAGAQPPQALRLPDPAEYTTWLESGLVRLMTLAPELEGALALVRAGRARGVRFAAGHTAASYAEMLQAAEAGVTLAAHTFNAMRPLHHREPGAVGAALTDERLFAEIIADGVHIHPAVVRLAVRARGVERVVLVSDAMRAAGLPDGEYELGGQPVQVQGGVALTRGGRLAGSTLTLDAAVRNAMQFAALTFPDALRMATRTPAEALGLAEKKGALQPGADADVVVFDASLQVQATMAAGKILYQRATGKFSEFP